MGPGNLNPLSYAYPVTLVLRMELELKPVRGNFLTCGKTKSVSCPPLAESLSHRTGIATESALLRVSQSQE
jgi:hypothetical protein